MSAFHIQIINYKERGVMKIEKNIHKKGKRYYVNIVRKKCDFSASFSSLDEAKDYLNLVKGIEHGSRTWEQKGIIYKGQAFIILSRRGEGIFPILVDNEDLESLMKINWCITKNGYAFGYYKGQKMFMHQYVNHNNIDGYVINHINHNKLDNRKSNLEVISHAENIKKGYENKKKRARQKV
jgi:HNH endonuclease